MTTAVLTERLMKGPSAEAPNLARARMILPGSQVLVQGLGPVHARTVPAQRGFAGVPELAVTDGSPLRRPRERAGQAENTRSGTSSPLDATRPGRLAISERTASCR